MPTHELERLRHIETHLAPRLITVHPLFQHRVDFLVARPAVAPAVTLSASESEPLRASSRSHAT